MSSAGPPTPDELDDLAHRARAGDSSALDRLLAALRPRILGICRGVLPYTPDAEDACQEAMLSVATKLGSWHGQGRVTSWVHVVALNAARSAGTSGVTLPALPAPNTFSRRTASWSRVLAAFSNSRFLA